MIEYSFPIHDFKENKYRELVNAPVRCCTSKAGSFQELLASGGFANYRWPVQGHSGHWTQKAKDLSFRAACTRWATLPRSTSTSQSCWKGKRHHTWHSDWWAIRSLDRGYQQGPDPTCVSPTIKPWLQKGSPNRSKNQATFGSLDPLEKVFNLPVPQFPHQYKGDNNGPTSWGHRGLSE